MARGDDDDDDDEGAAAAAAHKSDRPIVQLAEQVARARQLIADDTRLEFIEADEEWCASPAAMFGCVHFRLTGAASNGKVHSSIHWSIHWSIGPFSRLRCIRVRVRVDTTFTYLYAAP